MKSWLRFAAFLLAVLVMETVVFGQHYKQTKLPSSKSGVAEVTDPQLINPLGANAYLDERLVGR
jgi:hypothetical protein